MSAAAGASRDVIVAHASAPGDSRMAVVRVSGNQAFSALKALDLQMPAGTVRRCVRAVLLRLQSAQLPCYVACMPGPGSYTGEDSFELLVPGHTEIIRRTIAALCDAAPGTRLAAPGEFTLRAFEQGRLTLEQAEGVAATIAARTDAEVHAAAMLRSGVVGRRVHDISEAIADMLALVEAGIDFTDQEDVVAITRQDLGDGIAAAIAALQKMVDGSVPLERLASAPWVVFSGPTNAGKSALMNALLGQQRAVVAEVAGTTRDVLVEPWRVHGKTGALELLLVDAPGEMHDASGLDALGQRMRDHAMRRATITLQCSTDASSTSTHNNNTIQVRTKCDQASTIDSGDAICTSAKTGAGLEQLTNAVARTAENLGATTVSESMVLADRHHALIHEAIDHLYATQQVCAVGQGRQVAHPELIAAALHGALESLGGISGRLAADDILGRIFSRFCVGK